MAGTIHGRYTLKVNYLLLIAHNIGIMRSNLFIVYFGSVFTWVAAVTDKTFAESSYETGPVRRVQQTRPDYIPHDNRRKLDHNGYTSADSIPDEFDAREYFTKCTRVLSQVRDQGNCASSWAVSVASAFTDRLCIATDGQFTKKLSAQHIMSCGDDKQAGCQGGSAYRAWEFTKNHGVVTGGNFNSKEGCQPYRRRYCDHAGDLSMKNCSTLGPMRPTICQRKCFNSQYNVDYESDLHKTSEVYMTSWTNTTQIQQEIMTYGPVTAAMYVYENFMNYKTGVYKDTTGELIGYHHVKLIGWGVEQDQDGSTEYWLAMNSWNSGWGDRGLFKILRGYNFCSIELLVMAGMVERR
ncbi:cathepsin B-like cysteine proteinase 4 [Adelges cooleyi]|uniref:cathepsin B-like cysteine proteinase 4 n=1 Tax=Adelges cooleyi TaxID=133065 RepID=UPI00217F2565|nr:cathepsin B-like cysteine proteinase 4 [Adelges cooleyi]